MPAFEAWEGPSRILGSLGFAGSGLGRAAPSNVQLELDRIGESGASPCSKRQIDNEKNKEERYYSASSPAEAARAAAAASLSARAPSRASSCADASNRAIARASPRGAKAAVSEGVSLQD